jgi:glucosyl-3-phosphoglycerate synthase
MTTMHRRQPQRFRAGDFDVPRLVEAKAGQRISVCLPARDEESTVGAIVEIIRRDLVDGVGLVDELLVVDDHSSDGTADVAAAAGAKVVDAASILPDYGEGHGKGEALWKSLFVSDGDIVVWCDSDIRDFDAGFIVGLVGPLIHHPEIDFVKGFYDRPLDGASIGGGRVTELAARPALSLLFPELATIVQPLAGEYAGRREVLERVPFVEGYGVDIALLIDVAQLVGIDRMAQVDLGVRVHRNRTLAELSPQAMAVLQAVLRRADPDLVAPVVTLYPPDLESNEAAVMIDAISIDGSERPPIVDVRARA